jgi:hypothetical protein
MTTNEQTWRTRPQTRASRCRRSWRTGRSPRRGRPRTDTIRGALAALSRATVQVQKAGTNLNQAVAALNATGQPPGNLAQYARYTTEVIRRLDETAVQVARLLP